MDLLISSVRKWNEISQKDKIAKLKKLSVISFNLDTNLFPCTCLHSLLGSYLASFSCLINRANYRTFGLQTSHGKSKSSRSKILDYYHEWTVSFAPYHNFRLKSAYPNQISDVSFERRFRKIWKNSRINLIIVRGFWLVRYKKRTDPNWQ